MCLMRIDSPKKPKFRPSVTIHFPEACSFKKKPNLHPKN